jgi:hypothetical protein
MTKRKRISKTKKKRTSKIQNFICDENLHILEWIYEGERIQLDAKDFDSAIVDNVNDRVFALEAGERLPTRLHIFSASGKEIVSLNPPDGYQFYYLGAYGEFGVSVVCITNVHLDEWGRGDSHFCFDPKTNNLFRVSLAY